MILLLCEALLFKNKSYERLQIIFPWKTYEGNMEVGTSAKSRRTGTSSGDSLARGTVTEPLNF